MQPSEETAFPRGSGDAREEEREGCERREGPCSCDARTRLCSLRSIASLEELENTTARCGPQSAFTERFETPPTAALRHRTRADDEYCPVRPRGFPKEYLTRHQRARPLPDPRARLRPALVTDYDGAQVEFPVLRRRAGVWLGDAGG